MPGNGQEAERENPVGSEAASVFPCPRRVRAVSPVTHRPSGQTASFARQPQHLRHRAWRMSFSTGASLPRMVNCCRSSRQICPDGAATREEGCTRASGGRNSCKQRRAIEGPRSKVHDSFQILDARVLQDVSGQATRLRHRTSGAEILAICNTDSERVFGIFFETCPERSDGVAHLLEHLVFRGSQQFPATHLYSALVQGTLLTGLNASTRADNTLYHLSSGEPEDFADLINILLDAVFHPLLRDQDILEEREVVINEMTGHQAVAQQQILEKLRQGLLPQSAYSLDYGGTPNLLATLSPDELRHFHAAQYHPSTARLFLWGDVDLAARLDQIDRLLGSGPRPFPAPTFSSSRPAARHQDIPFQTPDENSAFTGLGWAFELKDVDLWQVLSRALVAEPRGAIRQALADTKTRLFGPGFTADTPLGTFEIALTGHGPETRSKTPSMIQSVLEQLATEGIAPACVRRAVDSLELNLRGLGTPNPGPQGLRALNLIRGRWRHGADPLAELDITARLADLHTVMDENPAALQQLLQRDLLDNPHRCTVSLKPQRIGPPRIARPTPPRPVPDPSRRSAGLALPSVARTNTAFRICRSTHTCEANILHVPVPGPDLCRAELAVSLGGLTTAQLAIVPIFVSLLNLAHTGDAMSITAQVRTTSVRSGPDQVWLWQSGRSLPSQAENLLRRMRGARHLGAVDAASLKGKIEADIAGLRARIALAGQDYCETRLRARTGSTGAWNEYLNGISQMTALNDLAAVDPTAVFTALVELGQYLLEAPRVHLAVGGIDPSLAQQLFTNRDDPSETAPVMPWRDLSQKEGLATAASNFTVGQAVSVTASGAARVIARLLETGWLWESVRVAGGAYSARCRYNTGDGLLTLLSIRDPNALATLDRFAQSPLWLTHNARGHLLARCIAATAAQLAAGPRPDDAVSVALRRHLAGETDAQRQAELDAISAISEAAIHKATEEMAAQLAHARTVVLGPEDQLRATLESRPDAFDLEQP